MIAFKLTLLFTNVLLAFILLEIEQGLAIVNMVAALALMLDLYFSADGSADT